MNHAMTSPSTVTRELVPEDQRLAVAERLFGMAFPTAIGTGHLRHHGADGRGLRRRLLGVLDAGQRRLLYGTVRGSHLPRELRNQCTKAISRPTRWGSRSACTPTAISALPVRRLRGYLHRPLSLAQGVHDGAPRGQGDPGRDGLSVLTTLPPPMPRC